MDIDKLINGFTALMGEAQETMEPKQIASTLISAGAAYALAIGWSPELVASAQRDALALHVNRGTGNPAIRKGGR